MEMYLRFRKLDAFDLLAIKEDATREQVEKAFIDYCAKFLPARFASPELQAMEEKARDLFLAGAGLRRLSIRRPQLPHRPPPEPPAAQQRGGETLIKSNLLDSETQFARDGLVKQEVRDALSSSSSRDCEPQNGLYRAELVLPLPQGAGVRSQGAMGLPSGRITRVRPRLLLCRSDHADTPVRRSRALLGSDQAAAPIGAHRR
jgi:hypothetical protein